jgi:hypothetical protein
VALFGVVLAEVAVMAVTLRLLPSSTPNPLRARKQEQIYHRMLLSDQLSPPDFAGE